MLARSGSETLSASFFLPRSANIVRLLSTMVSPDQVIHANDIPRTDLASMAAPSRMFLVFLCLCFPAVECPLMPPPSPAETYHLL